MTGTTRDDVLAARERISGVIRRTPVIAAHPAREPAGGMLRLKLECLQVTGSFKPRGAMSKATTLDARNIRGLITASGGNHGLGVAYAARCLGLPSVVYLPGSASADKADTLRSWGAEVRIHGRVWDESNEAALAAAVREDLVPIHPFADPEVVAGQGTAGLEILEDAPDIDALVVAVGGGGLIAGVAVAVKPARPDLRIIGVEPVGAPTLHDSLAAGGLVTLDGIATEAGSLAPRRSDPLNFGIISGMVDEIVLVTDDEMRRAARWLWSEYGIGTELAGAAGVAAVMQGRVEARAPLALVCGAGSDGLAQRG